MLSLLIALWLGVIAHTVNPSGDVQPWDLPVLPAAVIAAAEAKGKQPDPISGKYIPRSAWIAVRNSSQTLATHMTGPLGFIARNDKWKVHFEGNEEKDRFMDQTFAGTSFLWAYHVLNPVIGTAKSELWRLGVLFVHGGVYMDDDADILMPLDEVISTNDKFIVGKESYNYTDMCYTDDFPLSNRSLIQRFGEKQLETKFDNRFFFNWALFSAPGHILVRRSIEHAVALIRREYIGHSAIKMAASDARGKLLMCASTFPITLAARELLLEGNTMESLGLRVGAEQFIDIKANMKAWNNDHNPHRWVKQMNKHRMNYLREYRTPSLEEALLWFEGHAIQAAGHREIYLLDHGRKRAFNGLDSFLSRGFTLDTVTTLNAGLVSQIPNGDPVVSG